MGQSMANSMDKAIEYKNKPRFFGSYYRVAFFGKEWDDYDGRIYIYKEPGITPLAEIHTRLRDLYSKRFTAEKFEIISDSKPITEMKLDPNRVYLQLTSVQPYFDKNEINRENDFEKSQHVSTFVYSTPFTKEGKARTDDVTKQWITQNLIET